MHRLQCGVWRPTCLLITCFTPSGALPGISKWREISLATNYIKLWTWLDCDLRLTSRLPWLLDHYHKVQISSHAMVKEAEWEVNKQLLVGKTHTGTEGMLTQWWDMFYITWEWKPITFNLSKQAITAQILCKRAAIERKFYKPVTVLLLKSVIYCQPAQIFCNISHDSNKIHHVCLLLISWIMNEPIENKSLPAEMHITDRKSPPWTQNNKYKPVWQKR